MDVTGNRGYWGKRVLSREILFSDAGVFSGHHQSIELLPREVKDKIFDLIVEKKSIDVIGDFLKSNA